MSKKLYLSDTDKKLAEYAGIAEYFDIDSTLVRLAWVILSLLLSLGFGGLIVYIIAAIIMPNKPYNTQA